MHARNMHLKILNDDDDNKNTKKPQIFVDMGQHFSGRSISDKTDNEYKSLTITRINRAYY